MFPDLSTKGVKVNKNNGNFKQWFLLAKISPERAALI